MFLSTRLLGFLLWHLCVLSGCSALTLALLTLSVFSDVLLVFQIQVVVRLFLRLSCLSRCPGCAVHLVSHLLHIDSVDAFPRMLSHLLLPLLQLNSNDIVDRLTLQCFNVNSRLFSTLVEEPHLFRVHPAQSLSTRTVIVLVLSVAQSATRHTAWSNV